MSRASDKLKEWLLRYGPAELVSLALTVAGGWLGRRLGQKEVSCALMATWAGNIGFFGIILLQDMFAARRKLAQEGKRYRFNAFLKNVRAMVLEFGIAEVLDSFFIRPFLLYRMPQLTGSLTSGLIAGKFLADITFYIPAILSYEWSKRRFRDF